MLIENLYEEAQQALRQGRLQLAIKRINEAGRELAAIGVALGYNRDPGYQPLSQRERCGKRIQSGDRSPQRSRKTKLSKARRYIPPTEVNARELARATALLNVLIKDVAVRIERVQEERHSLRKRRVVENAFEEHSPGGGRVLDLCR